VPIPPRRDDGLRSWQCVRIFANLPFEPLVLALGSQNPQRRCTYTTYLYVVDLESELAGVKAEHRDLLNRIEKLEASEVDAFNEHIEEVLDLLGYDNIERIWSERATREVGGDDEKSKRAHSTLGSSA
jgi:hypothetical protein